MAIFIDGSNLFLSSRDGNVNVAPEDLKRKLVRGRGLGALEYFGSSRDPPSETEERWIGGFRDAGFHVHIFPLQSRNPFHIIAPRAVERMEIKYRPDANPDDYLQFFEKGVDVALTTSMLAVALGGGTDVVVLVSGDGDFVPPVREVARRGIEVEVAAFRGSVKRELVEAATRFVDLEAALTSS